MHIDLNSCFASIEQQANPLLRGKPVAVAAYPTPGGCILAASYEAKKLGVKTGLRVREGRELCPELIVLPPDPPKYRFVSQKLMQLFRQYSPDCVPKSVDEAVLDFRGLASRVQSARFDREAGRAKFKVQSCSSKLKVYPLEEIGAQIKWRIKEEIGDWLKVNVGIGPNRFLAKTAASWHKPDGLDEINASNLRTALAEFSLTDLCGINVRYQARLNAFDIFTPLDFLDSSLLTLRQAFGGICGYYWYLRLRGWEIDDVSFPRRSFGQSYALPRQTADPRELSRLLCKLCEKMGRRLREASFQAFGIHVACLYDHHDFWHHGEKGRTALYSTRQLFVAAQRVLNCVKHQPVRILAVSCFALEKVGREQLDLWSTTDRERQLAQALDDVNDRWGEFTIAQAQMLGMEKTILDRIAFGK